MTAPPLRLLIVEDEIVFAKVLAEKLAMEFDPLGGAACHAVASLSEAKAAMMGQHFDVVVLDLNLPDAKGLQTVYELARAKPELTPVVIVSGVPISEDEQVEAIRLGAQVFLSKSEVMRDPTILRRVIRYAIARSEQAAMTITSASRLSERIAELARERAGANR